MNTYGASEKYAIPGAYVDVQEGAKRLEPHVLQLQGLSHASTRRIPTSPSKVVRCLKATWTAITRIGTAIKPPCAPRHGSSRPSDPTKTSSEKHRYLDHEPAPVRESLPIIVDGVLVGQITIPDAFSSNIVGAELSGDAKSLALTTDTLPAYEECIAPKPDEAYKRCPTFDDETILFASAFLPYGKPLALWSGSGATITGDANRSQGARVSPASIRRKTCLAPGGVLQLPSMYDPTEVYMLGHADIFGRRNQHPLRSWVDSLTRETAGTGLFVRCAPHVEAGGYTPAVLL